MVDEAVKLGSRLHGNDLIIYVLCLGLLGVIFYLLKTMRAGINEINENSKLLAGISEQLRILVQSAMGRKDV